MAGANLYTVYGRLGNGENAEIETTQIHTSSSE